MTLGVQQAADILLISPATVRNWLKTGVLKSTSELHIRAIQKKIKTGKLNKLQTRANRAHSKTFHGHTELLLNISQVSAFEQLLRQYTSRKKELLFGVYIAQLADLKMIKAIGEKFIIPAKIKAELAAWDFDVETAGFLDLFGKLKSDDFDLTDNLLSYLHQSMSATSEKQSLGAYYTPADVVDKAISRLKKTGTFCDPCCGSGNFLVAAYKHFEKLGGMNSNTLVFGFDSDELAVLIARANLTLASRGKIDVLKAVRQKDFLRKPVVQTFDYMVTNPPWGAFSSEKDLSRLQEKFKLPKVKESFSFFVAATLANLKKDGRQILVLPQSFMNVKTHGEIRKYLFSNYSVNRIDILTAKFSGVLSGSILIETEKAKPSKEHKVVVHSAGICEIGNADILLDPGCNLPINNNSESLAVLKEIEKKSAITLRGKSRWGLGLVTGDNEKYIAHSPADGRIPVVKGSDLYRYIEPFPNSYLTSDFSRFQQKAPLEIYRHEKKLIYRFICKELVFTVDTSGVFTLNSANILIPELAGYSCELLCAVFNSKLAQFYYTKKFASVKILRSHLENFPLPPRNEKLFAKMESFYHQLRNNSGKRDTTHKLNELVMEAYGISEKTKNEIRKAEFSGAFE